MSRLQAIATKKLLTNYLTVTGRQPVCGEAVAVWNGPLH